MVKGAAGKLRPDRRGERSPHTRPAVYGVMLAQICRDYTVLPALDQITAEEILWFYDKLKPDLIEQTKPKD